MALQHERLSVACEICVTTRVDHEIGNLSKCLAAGFDYAVLVCGDKSTLESARDRLKVEDHEHIRFIMPDSLGALLEELVGKATRAPDAARHKETRPVRTDGSNPRRAEASEQVPSAPPDGKKRLLIARDAASYIGMARQTLAKLRWAGTSPPFYKVGRQVLYDRADLDSWLSVRRRRSTSDLGD